MPSRVTWSKDKTNVWTGDACVVRADPGKEVTIGGSSTCPAAVFQNAASNCGFEHSLGFTLVAEGVESEQILAALAGLGCDVAQGYHLSSPITAAAFYTWCTGRHITPIRLPATGSSLVATSPAGGDVLASTAT